MQHVDVKVHDGVATLLMDRKPVRNALSPGLITDLQQAFSDVHQEKRVRSVVLAGAGDHFCSGVDLSTLQEINQAGDFEAFGQWHAYWHQLTETIEQMLRFPKPIVAAVDGGAVGAGFALALAADMIVCSQSAFFTAAAQSRGLVGGATVALLHFRLGGAITSRLIHTGEIVDAEQAARIHLTSAVVPSEQVWGAACDLGRRSAGGPAESSAATKRLLNETIGESLFSQLAAAAAASATACTTEAATEGVSAFLDKRDAAWP